jgi:hypothetical protein
MDVVHLAAGAAEPRTYFSSTPASLVAPADATHSPAHTRCLHLHPCAGLDHPPRDLPVCILGCPAHGNSFQKPRSCGRRLDAGVGVARRAGKPHALDRESGAILIGVESPGNVAQGRGISSPLRLIGQPWTGEESRR